GRLLGTTEHPDVDGGGLLYGADVGTGEVLFHKKLPRALSFRWGHGTTQWDYVKGPDGNVYTYLGNVLVLIRPANAEVDALGVLKRVGRLCFVGNDLYLAGDEPVRRLKGIAAR
ncbi:MAG: hypothetical protein ACYTG0_28715, partial [Planctomycetota bacterium]